MLLFGIVPAGLILTTLVIVTALRMFASARSASEAALRLMADRVAAEIERGNTRAVLASKMLAFAQMDGLFGQRTASLAYARRVLEQFPEFTGSYFAYEVTAEKPLEVRYRFWLQEGQMMPDEVARLAAAFAEPPRVAVK